MEPEFNEEIEGDSLDIAEEKPRSSIPKEMAESEFQAWADHLRLDTDKNDMDAEEKADFRQIKKKFVFALMNGITQTEDNGDLTFNLAETIKVGNSQKSQITFRRSFKGSAFVVMDRYKESQAVHKTSAFLGAWVGIDPKNLMNMDARDLWFGMKMVSLFFGA